MNVFLSICQAHVNILTSDLGQRRAPFMVYPSICTTCVSFCQCVREYIGGGDRESKRSLLQHINIYNNLLYNKEIRGLRFVIRSDNSGLYICQKRTNADIFDKKTRKPINTRTRDDLPGNRSQEGDQHD